MWLLLVRLLGVLVVPLAITLVAMAVIPRLIFLLVKLMRIR